MCTKTLYVRSDWRCGYCETVVSFGAIDDVMNTLEKQIGQVSEKGVKLLVRRPGLEGVHTVMVWLSP